LHFALETRIICASPLPRRLLKFPFFSQMKRLSTVLPGGVITQKVVYTFYDIFRAEHCYMMFRSNRPKEEATVRWKNYNHRINYSADNEDSSTEIEALANGARSRLICITAGGGRVLNLLVNQPKEVWAVDVNPCQCYLLELKLAALRTFDYPAFIAFMGIAPLDSRMEAYHAIRPQLSPEAAAYFDRNIKYIKKGVLFQGNLERFFALTSKIVHLPLFGGFRRLFDFDDLDEQREYLNRKWDSLFWRGLKNLLCRKKFLYLVADDPGFLRYLPEELPVHEAIFECIYRYLWNNLAKENHLLSLIVFNRYVNEPSVPHYLQKEPFEKIKAALDEAEIKIINGLIGDVLKEAPEDTFNGYSISDIASYMSKPAFYELLDNIIRTAQACAKLCARHCFIPLDLPERYDESVRRNRYLEQKFAKRDHAMVHEYLVGDIRCAQ
jgi:S-adenosylmethionine-diacylglycerol 3-amino-3-carboxypropyl transferase